MISDHNECSAENKIRDRKWLEKGIDRVDRSGKASIRGHFGR
jgi:hypothetical protein